MDQKSLTGSKDDDSDVSACLSSLRDLSLDPDRITCRQILVEKTKSFRALNSSDQLKALGSLVVAYQKEVDRLSGVVDTYYTLLAKCRSSITPYIASQTKRLAKVNEQLIDREEELRSLNDQSVKLHQLEIQNKQLKTEMNARANAVLAEAMKEAEMEQADIVTRFEKRETELKSLLTKVQQQAILSEQQRNQVHSELIEMRTARETGDQILSSHSFNSLNAELEDARRSIQTLQLTNEDLREQITSIKPEPIPKSGK